MGRGAESKMRGSLQKNAALASNPPDTDRPNVASARQRHDGADLPDRVSSPTRQPPSPPGQSLEPFGTTRKRSYGARETPQESPTTQLAGDLEATVESGSDEEDESPRGSKRARPSPKHTPHTILSPGGSGGSLRKGKRLTRASPRVTPRNDAKSRFLEGSMRDRESQRPPHEYIHVDGEIHEQPLKESDSTPLPIEPGNERPRSGVFRFGRAIANAFNPSVVWHGMFGREKSSSVSPTKSDMNDDRKARAEKAYAELKRQGARGTRRPSAGSSVRDSGIDVDSGRTSEDRKRDSVVFDSSTTTPATETFPQSGSPDATSDGGRRNRRRPSITNLHKMKSHFSLKNLRREAASPPMNTAGSASMYRVKKKASKKDLGKQKKLTKRISNLESQLERARRELANSMGAPEVPLVPEIYQQELDSTPGNGDDSLISDVSPHSHRKSGEESVDSPGSGHDQSPVESPPANLAPMEYVRPRFVPGALPSLPSERLLLAPDRALPATPTTVMMGSPKKLDRVMERKDSIEADSSAQDTPRNSFDTARIVRKSSIPRATRPTRKGGLEDAELAQDAAENVEPMKRPAQAVKTRASKLSPKYQFVDSSDSASGSGSETSIPSNHHEMQFKTRGRGGVHLRGGMGDGHVSGSSEALGGHHGNASSINLASMANITDGSSARDLSGEISATDLRGLYASSAFVQARRLRALGPNSPHRRASANSITDAPGRGVIRKRSVSPRQTRSRTKSGAGKKNAPVTATPGSGDGRGEIVPPLPTGKPQASGEKTAAKVAGARGVGKGRPKGLASDSTWEGWDDDVF